MTRTRRTDPHRPGAIVPAEYEAMLDYSLSTTDGGWPIPAIGMDCTIELAPRDENGLRTGAPGAHRGGRCCVLECVRVARHENGCAVFGSPGQCGVCGAHYVYGTLYRHHPTGELVHMGHDCADKYELLRDHSEWELENGRVRAACAKECARVRNAEERAAFLESTPGLAEALETDHPIVADIKARFQQWRELSEKQIELVFKIADEVAHPAPPKPEDVKIPGPLGKVEFKGTIVSAKIHEGEWGTSWKITVKVVVPGTETGGCWLAWGTAPAALTDAVRGEIEADPARARGDRHDEMRAGMRGREVHLRATLEAGNEEHFRFMKRPTIVGAKKAKTGQAFAETIRELVDPQDLTRLADTITRKSKAS